MSLVYVYFITTANIQKVFDFVYINTFFYVLFLMVIKKTLSLQHTLIEIKEPINKEKLNKMKQTILVTGGTGFIGSHTSVELIEAGYEVVIVDDLSNSKIEVLDGIEKITGVRPAFEQVDLRDREATENVFRKYPKIEGIIHFAASKAVGESVQLPLMYYRNNIVSLLNLLELMPEYNVKGIIFSSSCTVYGQPKPENLPVTEDAPHQKATSPYGNTKEINEQIILDYIHSGADIKSIVLRYFNPIGAHPSALIGELPNGVPNNLIPFVTQTAMGIRKELTIFGQDYDTPDGTCIRDYIYVVDLAKAHVAAMARVLDQDTEKIEYFNVGTGSGNSTKEIVDTFEKATGVKVNWKYGPRREGDIEKIWGDCTKANTVLGWKADTPLADVLATAWKWQEKLREDGIM
jgi:UDP-glucose 4-epimerase